MNSKVGKRIFKIFIYLIIVLVILIGSVFIWIKATIPQSFPQVEGEIHLDGLDAQVNVYRDSMGIPNIYASTSHDLFMVQGYLHAQDRFWQMDFWRHIGAARLSEMFPSEVDTDIFLRTLGWSKLAEQEYANLDVTSKDILLSYSAGVNQYLETHAGSKISLEYAILKLLNPGYSPEEWTPVNTLTWAKSMAWDLGDNMDSEIERAILLKTLPPSDIEELYPPYPSDHPVIVPSIEDNVRQGSAFLNNLDIPYSLLSKILKRSYTLSAIIGPNGVDIGSNSWVVSGELTNTGMPLLANDPHLGIQMPSIWYQVGLHCTNKNKDCPYNVTGFSFAGVPGVVIGHNEKIAWGFTNVGPDVMDLFIEEINPQNPNQYKYQDNWIDMELRKEIITVAGKDPVEVTVRSTLHGPIISDTYGKLKEQVETPDLPFSEKAGVDLPEQYAIALSWTALEPNQLFSAIWGFDRANNWDEFRDAARNFAVPSQNLVYADGEGNIGYQMPGNIPIRKSGDGRLPMPGWTGEFDWVGYIPFEDLPYMLNPSSGYIVTANNQVNPWDYQGLITTEFDYGFRAARIEDMISTSPSKLDINLFKTIQADNYDASASLLVPYLEDITFDDDFSNEIRSRLLNWDFQDHMDSPEAAFYATFWSEFLKTTFGDELPFDMQPGGSSRWFEVVRNMISNPESSWWDSTLTSDVIETREMIISQSFSQAVARIQDTLGKDPAKWKWGSLHTSTFQNQTLGQSGISLIENLFNRGPFATSGGASIVNATGWNASKGFEVSSIPSMRMIVDLGDMRNSLTVHPTGQSGHAYHPHYIDMADLWRNIQYYPMLWNEQAIVNSAESHLVFTP